MPGSRHGTRVVHHATAQRRKLVWATAAESFTLAPAARRNTDLLGNLKTVGASVLGTTVMRTHTVIAVTDTVAGAPAMGLYLGWVVDDAPTATNLDPSTSFGDDWMLLTQLAPGYARNSSVLGDAGGHIYYGERFDLRAKRKIEELNEQYLLCYENAGANTISVGMFTRTLLALP